MCSMITEDLVGRAKEIDPLRKEFHCCFRSSIICGHGHCESGAMISNVADIFFLSTTFGKGTHKIYVDSTVWLPCARENFHVGKMAIRSRSWDLKLLALFTSI